MERQRLARPSRAVMELGREAGTADPQLSAVLPSPTQRRFWAATGTDAKTSQPLPEKRLPAP